MKRFPLLVWIIFSYLLLVGCASHRYPFPSSALGNETWQRQIDTNPAKWARGADHWFLTGDPNATEIADKHAPYSSAMSLMEVRVPDFTEIQVNGDFQVQLYGATDHNSVRLLGPNEGIRQVNVQIRGNTLCIDQPPKASPRIRNVIVRIGIVELRKLTQLGNGSIEGVQLHSQDLRIKSFGGGNIYLAGRLNVRDIYSASRGSVTVFGAYTPQLDIKTTGSGSVNVSGSVGARTLSHQGSGDINLIGVATNQLNIYTQGRGKIGLVGNAINVCHIYAKDETCVYAYTVRGGKILVEATGKACVGLAGTAAQLNVKTSYLARFFGRHLCVGNILARASGSSHMNIAASGKVFASATQSSSIYFYGTPEQLSPYVSGDSVIIPVWTNGSPTCAGGAYCPVSYKGENHGMTDRYKTWRKMHHS